jgi:formylglycine-generating enzyme required for sulfatase activity
VGGAEVHDAGVTPTTLSLPASSVTLTLEAEGRARVLVPLLLDPDEPREVTVALPLATQVPPGFTWIPPGDFLFGAGGDEGLRTYFLNAEPMHRVTTPGYLIAVHETTFAEWIDFLSSLPREERARRRPDVSWMVHGVSLLDTPKGFRLRLTTAEHVHEVAWGEPLRFDARPERTSLDWGQLPVSGISFQDAEAYFAWLRSTGRVPNARACTDVEWERAARGADGRTWPHGEKLEPEDANFDLTWGRSPERFGPDTVGSHPRSRSPFGLFDTSGNVWEWTVDAHDPTQVTNRGGSWYQGRVTAQLANRELSEPAHRDPLLGLRVCADLVTSK